MTIKIDARDIGKYQRKLAGLAKAWDDHSTRASECGDEGAYYARRGRASAFTGALEESIRMFGDHRKAR